MPLEKLLTSEYLSDLSSEDESEAGNEDQGPSTELEQHMLTIISILADLYKLSFKMRNPAIRKQSLKPILYKETDEETNLDTLAEYAHYDLNHIVESFTQLRRETAEQMSSISPETSEAQEGMYLVERLAVTINNRRRALRYWQRHAKKLAAKTDAPEVGAIFPLPQSSPTQLCVKPALNADQFPQRMQPAAHLTAPSSILSGTEATTYDRALDSCVDTQSVISYVSTAIDVHGNVVDIPNAPFEASIKSEFLCPYCGIVCPSREGTKRTWRWVSFTFRNLI